MPFLLTVILSIWFHQPGSLNSIWFWVFPIQDLLACAVIISVVMFVSFCFILSFSTFKSLTHSAFLSCSISLPHMLNPKLFTLFRIWFFSTDVSNIILLLINFFLILDKYFVHLILVHFLFISLQLCCFLHRVAVSALVSLFLFHFSLWNTPF